MMGTMIVTTTAAVAMTSAEHHVDSEYTRPELKDDVEIQAFWLPICERQRTIMVTMTMMRRMRRMGNL